MADEITAGGNGADGKLSLLGADGKPIFAVAIDEQRPSNKFTKASLGAPDSSGLLELLNRDGASTVRIAGSNGGLNLGGRGKDGAKGSSSQIVTQGSDGSDQITLSAQKNRSVIFAGWVDRPGYLSLTQGGPTLFESVVLQGGDGTLKLGSGGTNGSASLMAADGKQRIGLTAADASIRVGGNGSSGTVSVLGTDGQPLVELLGSGNEAVIGLGQANRPGRISMFNGQRGETLRLDANSGDILLLNADCAEEFDIAESGVAPGTVMVLTDDGSLAPSEKPADTRVAGVVSGAGSFRPGLILDRRDTGAERAPIALMGKVYCLVDATEEPVRVGDLLTTAEYPGHAMRIVDPLRAVGAILGKALAPLAAGRDLIPILVSLQ